MKKLKLDLFVNKNSFIPVKHRVINAINNGSDKPHNKCKNHKIQNVIDHHNGESVLLMIIIHSGEK